ncbi:invasion associated locus B family protein [Roseivivax isoporae]|uniref:Invasion associated locus B family protein n=1 Tax=Roseivivax isoporae LMG 25204 TaxID=1449351 RepID=X7FDB1_9RHOB|nr:invasion associated locus B family protein [Roseivivax isoporae]ETX30753.1 invasion associated locus B family protein [Roseivivax isoporae LMG 25204]
MTMRLTHLALIAAMSAAPAFAQDATTGTTPEAEAPAGAAQDQGTEAPAGETAAPEAQTGDADEGVQNALDTGEAVNAQPDQDRTFIKSEEGEWQVECVRLPDGSEGPCQLFQLLEAAEGNPVAEARIFKVEGGGQVVAGANMIVPLETLLTQKLTIAVDNGQAKRYDFAFCTQIGCIARIGFTQEDVNQFRRGAVARVSIVPALAPDQQVVTEMSLSGFTAGFDALEPIQTQ